MATNIYNPSTGQTGYQVPGGALPAGWQWGAPSASSAPISSPTTTSTQSSSSAMPQTNNMLDYNISDIRNQLKSGQLNVQQAIQSAMNAGGNMISQTDLYNKLFGGLGPITVNGQQYSINPSDASVVRTSTQVTQSSTNGNGTTSTTSAVTPSNYTVKSGDSLNKIAADNGMTVQQLLVLNPQYATNPNLIRPGETVTLSNGQSSTPGITNTGASSSANNTQAGGTSNGAITAPASTGNAALDAVMNSLVGVANSIVSKGYTIPDTLQITPALISTFLNWAHQNVDPQTQQLIAGEAANINASLSSLQKTHDLTNDQTVQQFGTDLATSQNTAGANGVAFSGQRALNEDNLAASANRTLAQSDNSTAYQAGNLLRQGAADVGSANTSMFSLPSIAGGRVSTAGGQRGSADAGPTLDFGYNPSLYTAGNIPTSQNTALNNQQANFLSQYGTLAANNSNGSRSINDLLGMISGRPANASLSLT